MLSFGNVINPLPVTMSFQKPKEASFNPYEDNNGTIAAAVGQDFAILASDTRLSAGYSIHSRKQSKLFKLSSKTVIGISGCWCDTLTFLKILDMRFKMYQHEHNKEMSTPAVSQLVSSLLYYKRFFPYYISIVLAGLDDEGKGHCYGYDPIGHKGEGNCKVGGSAFSLIAPLLDNQIDFKNMQNVAKEPLSLEKAIALLKDSFISAGERDIYTGDSLEIKIITKDGIKEESIPLRRD